MNDVTIHSIAGFCNEQTLWKLLVDLSSELLNKELKAPKIIMPEMIVIDGDSFRLSDDVTRNPTSEFCPPEGDEHIGSEGLVWSLAALVCYVSSGHFVFGGRGGSYQRNNPKVELPTLKKEHSALTPLVRRCLCYSPSERIGLRELQEVAQKGLESNEQMNRPKRMDVSRLTNNDYKFTDEVWPEKISKD